MDTVHRVNYCDRRCRLLVASRLFPLLVLTDALLGSAVMGHGVQLTCILWAIFVAIATFGV